MSKVGKVSPCFKKVGTSDYWEGHFVKFTDDSESTLTLLLLQAFFISKLRALFIVSITIAAP